MRGGRKEREREEGLSRAEDRDLLNLLTLATPNVTLYTEKGRWREGE